MKTDQASDLRALLLELAEHDLRRYGPWTSGLRDRVHAAITALGAAPEKHQDAKHYELAPPLNPELLLKRWNDLMNAWPADGYVGAANVIAAHAKRTRIIEKQLDIVDPGWREQLLPHRPVSGPKENTICICVMHIHVPESDADRSCARCACIHAPGQP
jgi:hypothetical protein